MPHELAGKPAPPSFLIDVDRLIEAYYSRRPDLADPEQLVSFGTSGHRGSSLSGAFNEAHILAITQALCDYRRAQGIDGPLVLGKDTHALSVPAEATALEVLAANGVTTLIQRGDGFTPTPAVSRAILTHNRGRATGLADGVVVTPSHNPPADGGFKYNPPNGGPADTSVTGWIQDRANTLLRAGNTDVKRIPHAQALRASTTRREDFVGPYVEALSGALDLSVIRSAGVRCARGSAGRGGARLLPGHRRAVFAGPHHHQPRRRSAVRLHDPGPRRQDPHGLLEPLRHGEAGRAADHYRVAFGNDADADRHGIVRPIRGSDEPQPLSGGGDPLSLLHRPEWPAGAAVGKTLVSSAIIDRVARAARPHAGRGAGGLQVVRDGPAHGALGFGGEESAGASFLQRDGTVWTTDKDGILLALLAAEITARTGKDPGEHYRRSSPLTASRIYTRVDEPATPQEKLRLKQLAPSDVKAAASLESRFLRG